MTDIRDYIAVNHSGLGFGMTILKKIHNNILNLRLTEVAVGMVGALKKV